MAFLIEQLTGVSSVRHDDKRLSSFVRPLPQRPRDFYDLIAALGRAASWDGLSRGITLKGAEPAALMFTVLGRWPSAAEFAAIERPYKPGAHIRQMLQSPEFRRTFLRRVLEAHPDRPRIVHIRIPRCGNAYLRSLIPESHPVLPTDLGAAPTMPLGALLTAIGTAMHRFPIASSVVVAGDRLAPFVYPPAAAPPGDDPLNWTMEVPALRQMDMAFAVLRDPEELLVSHVNGTLHALAAGEGKPADKLRRVWGAPPALHDAGAWKDLGRRIFAEAALADPICHALGDGTAEAALALCRVSGIRLVGLGRLTDWAHTTLACEPAEPENAAPPHLRREDLDRAALAARTRQDRVFFDRFAALYNPAEVTFVKGSAL